MTLGGLGMVSYVLIFIIFEMTCSHPYSLILLHRLQFDLSSKTMDIYYSASIILQSTVSVDNPTPITVLSIALMSPVTPHIIIQRTTLLKQNPCHHHHSRRCQSSTTGQETASLVIYSMVRSWPKNNNQRKSQSKSKRKNNY
jgi:hypothetical protein